MEHADPLRSHATRPRSYGGIGQLFMIAAMLLLPVGDTLAKLLTETVNPVAVVMWRLLAQGLVMASVALILRDRLRGPMLSPIVALSGALVCVTVTGLIAAFSIMPIATAIAIFFVEPLLLTALAGPLLGERAGPRRMAAVVVGLIGALVVIRPGLSAYGWATALPLVSALAYAANMIVLKRASAIRSGLTIQCGATAYAAAIMLLVVIGLFVAGYDGLRPNTVDGRAWATILGTGAFAAASYLLIAEAFSRAEAGALAPMQYLEIIGATVAGWLVFSTLPDVPTWIGMAIIFASGLYIFHREGQADTAPPRRRRGGR